MIGLAKLQVRQAALPDAEAISDILQEAAQWLEQSGMPLWQAHELAPDRMIADLKEGLFFLAEHSGTIVGTLRFQLEDPLYWPDQPKQDAAYLHRLAIRRSYAGTGLSTALLDWAVKETRTRQRRYLRLDCLASRTRLREIYERFGFRYHSAWQLGIYPVARYEYDVQAMEIGMEKDPTILLSSPD